ncbi:MAG: NAAT family transporter [Nitrospinae bacterium]|nr:NAAT family transporter [Nitrospinota bacterium]MZH04046.1 NAAT family transporter [Nitrospinota bacterium]MZH13678.1 NAAT family transporter [Nitrospinota bacterium]
MDATELIKTFVILVTVIDPIGNIPVYISLTSNRTDEEHKSIALKTSFSAVLLLATSFLFGKYIIGFFGIKMSAFKLIGGIFLVYISFTLLSNAKSSYLFANEEIDEKEDIAWMPLTFPLFIGPAALSIVIIQSDEISTGLERMIILSEFVVIGFLIWITLKLSKLILNSLGKTGTKFIHQIMGLLLGSLAIGMIADELKILLPGLS